MSDHRCIYSPVHGALREIPSPVSTWGRHEVHLWFISLESASLDQFSADENCLSRDERDRLAGIQSEKVRLRFARNRRVLRELLAAYLSLEPGEIDFRYGERGKPMLGKSLESIQLNFSVAHSQGYAVYAFSLGESIGVDLEFQRSSPFPGMVATHFYPKMELDLLMRYGERERCRRSLNLWCRKEALAKALGWSIMDTVGIDVSSSECLIDETEVDGAREPLQLYFQDLAVIPDYACAIATNYSKPLLKMKWADQPSGEFRHRNEQKWRAGDKE